MILDSIIGLFASIIGGVLVPAAEVLSFVFVAVVNLLAAAVEAIIRIFVSGFRLGRLSKWERKSGVEDDKPETPDSPMAIWWSILTATAIFAAIFLGPKIIHQNVTLVAKDGHSLPFATMIIHTKKGDTHIRTDNAGNITIPRFTTKGITIKDPRYIERRWNPDEIDSQLVVQRTILGSSLDSLADRLLKTAK